MAASNSSSTARPTPCNNDVLVDDGAGAVSFVTGYPILRFEAVPESVEVHIIDRPGLPFLGTGEASQGPTAAIANAVTDATGERPRELPILRPGTA